MLEMQNRVRVCKLNEVSGSAEYLCFPKAQGALKFLSDPIELLSG